MEDPVAEIPHVIHLLTQPTPSVQRRTIETYFTPSASLIHPFCRTGSFPGSRWLVLGIYRFYKILSPPTDVQVKSVDTSLAFDAENLLLYVTIFQNFRILIIPFYLAPVTLTTVLTLTTSKSGHDPQQIDGTPCSPTTPINNGSSPTTDCPHSPRPLPEQGPNHDDSPSRTLYYISEQNDLYQTSEFIKFVVPFGIGNALILFWQYLATFFCTMGAIMLWPISAAEEDGALPFARKDDGKMESDEGW
ncbi:hypothetical protein PRK78_007530 [Emydomyces testavorans]|uniref:SigF-like NTF2-like domain-containing protein n=1 Tax=Emydomyces testavorans TaxID=2070801 RepID=A0AAF0DS61_9EURO|nr:hypothetical protein PRK78_007530 [Emydomyces testavorans]